jgi:hypothetical protein
MFFGRPGPKPRDDQKYMSLNNGLFWAVTESYNPIERKVKLGLHLLEFPEYQLPGFVFFFFACDLECETRSKYPGPIQKKTTFELPYFWIL